MGANRDSRGLLNPLLVVLVVVVLGAVGFVGWKVANKNVSSQKSSVATNKAAEADCNKEINDQTFCKFVANLDLKDSYKVTITSTDDKGSTSKIEMENDKDNFSMVTKDASGKETGAFISLANDSYIKDETDGSWTKYSSQPTQDSSPTSDIKLNTSDLTSKNTISYKNLGKDGCGKLSCYKYQVVDSTSPDSTQYIWFDTKDYLMQRWYNQDKSGSSDMLFSFVKVTIKAPSPVKEASTPSAGSESGVNALIEAVQNASDSMTTSSDTSTDSDR